MFQQATRAARTIKVGIFGPAGSGKTFSALSLAQGLLQGDARQGLRQSRQGIGRVAVVDTEGGRAALYADRFVFDMLVLQPPFCPSSLAQALQAAQDSGYNTVVLDGISAAWSGPGGVLEQVDAARSQGRRAPWHEAGKAHEELMQAISKAQCHVLATVRARSLWQMVEQQTHPGVTVRRKVADGLRPDQRSDISYNFDVFWQLDRKTHTAWPVKDSSGLFEGRRQQLNAESGTTLALWARGDSQQSSGMERALQAIRSCGSVAELASLWGDWPESWRAHPWQEVCSRAVAQRLRELQAA